MLREFAVISMVFSATASVAANVSETAFQEITQQTSSRLYKQWGKASIARINSAMKNAVAITAKSDECDTVFLSGLSFEESSPPNKIVVFADCVNGKRFSYTEEDTKKSTSVPQSLQASRDKISDADAIGTCEDLAKRKSKFPSSVDASHFGANVTRNEMGISVALPFNAKNSLGVLLPYVAHCSLTGESATLLSIKEE